MALGAAGSFRRERETGVMELLLVSPLGIGRIIRGRLQGLWGQFGPGVALFIASWLYLIPVLARPYSAASAVSVLWLFGNTALTLPVVGLYFSLRSRLFILAAVVTMAGGVFVPGMGMVLLSDWFEERGAVFWSLIAMVVLPLAGSTLLWSWNRAIDRRWMLEILIGSAALSLASLYFVESVALDKEVSRTLAGAVLVAVTFQTSLAAWLGTRLSRDLAARNFSLPH